MNQLINNYNCEGFYFNGYELLELVGLIFSDTNTIILNDSNADNGTKHP